MVEATMETSLSRRSCAEPPTFIRSRSLRSRMRELLLSTGPIIWVRSPPPSKLNCVETIGGMQRPHRKFGVRRIDQNRNFDLGSGDRFDVDALLGKGAEHGGRRADMTFHA